MLPANAHHILIRAALSSMLALPALAQPAISGNGFTLFYNLSAGWTSNPTEIPTRERGDAGFRHDLTLGYRYGLWEGANAYLNTSVGSTFFVREHASGTHRASLTASIAQTWREATFTFAFAERKAMNSTLSAHDSASRELGLSATRTFTLRDGLTLNVFARGARRYFSNGSEHQWRAGINTTLVQKFGAYSLRLNGGFTYALEDKAIFLPRINDRSVFANIGINYEWATDTEIGVAIGFWRTYSSYPFDRYKQFSLGPRLATNWKF